ncbi:MAG TPA: hypothetical protein VEY70_24005 [Metabacillus sp.]|nr:hypothetical protein [Metabacillus sp.]
MLPLYCYPLYYGTSYFYGAGNVNGIQAYYHMPFNRQFPQVDPTVFEQSAKSMQTLMKEASLVLTKLAESKDFATKVMSAAQQSNMKEVDELIKSTGIKSQVKTSFNPDGIHMNLSSSIGEAECCHLTIALRWL